MTLLQLNDYVKIVFTISVSNIIKNHVQLYVNLITLTIRNRQQVLN